MNWDNVWIIGASTGIGHQIAIQLQGKVKNIVISARSEDKLQEMATGNPSVHPYKYDVTDRNQAAQVLDRIEADIGLPELVIYNPGLLKTYNTIHKFNADDCIQALSVNYMGAIYLLESLIPRMIKRGSGHIALTGSISSFRGIPGFAAYGPTKAAINNLAETLKLDLAPYNIDVSVINPGFIDTPMTEDTLTRMPYKITVEDAANRIIKGLESKRYEIAFPFTSVRLLKRLRSFPHSLFFFIAKRFLNFT